MFGYLLRVRFVFGLVTPTARDREVAKTDKHYLFFRALAVAVCLPLLVTMYIGQAFLIYAVAFTVATVCLFWLPIAGTLASTVIAYWFTSYALNALYS